MDLQVPATYTEAELCVREAWNNVRRVKQLLSEANDKSSDESAALLREAEIQLGCACAIFRKQGNKRDPEIQATLETLQAEIAGLAEFFAQADKLLSHWLTSIRTRQAGYTTRGQAAPLVLMKRVSLEG